jgi:hypothetical protein
MSEQTFQELDQLHAGRGAAAAIERVIETLRQNRDYHRLFDALLLQKKFEMGLPLAQPTSFDDVSEAKREEFEEAYIAAARQVGELLLAEGRLSQAWIYFRTIREPERVRDAIEAIDIRNELDEATEDVIQVALYEGANPVKGLEIMLRTHGTCNTITTLDQQMHLLSPADRHRAATLLVRNLYDDLKHTLQRDVERRLALVPPAETVRELIAGRDWLFEEGNYHIDVSHLNAVVRFARSLEVGSPELKKAIELAEYGSHLAPQFQYAGDPPFDDFYPAHVQFFRILDGDNRDAALGYFRDKLTAEPDAEDRQLIAYVLVDLLLRVDRLDEALEVAEQHLQNIPDSAGFSFAQLCQQAGRMDALRRVARAKGDLVSYTAALVQG